MLIISWLLLFFKFQEVTGIYTTIDLSLNTKGFPVFATVVEANYIVKKHDPFSAYKLTQEEREEIQKLAKDPRIGERVYPVLIDWAFSHLIGLLHVYLPFWFCF